MGMRCSLISFFKLSSNVLGIAPRAPTVTIMNVCKYADCNDNTIQVGSE